MANTHLAYPDFALDKLFDTDPDQYAESFVQLIERKIKFALSDAPEDPDDLVSYTFRKKALFSSLLQGPAAEWFENNFEKATTQAALWEQFITRFSDGRNKFRHRMEMEHCVRGDGEEIRNFLHRIKKIVDKGWPDEKEGIAECDRAAERQAQGRQRRQQYINYTLRGLRPRYLQRKAQEYMMEHPNATWNDFSTRIIQRDVSYQVSSNFLNDEEQTKFQLAPMGKEMKILRSELQEHRVNALENTRQPAPNQMGRQNVTRFCNYCRTNGHTPSWCRKKIRDEEVKKGQDGIMSEKRVTFTNDYNKRRGPNHGSGHFNYSNTGNRHQAGRDLTDTKQLTYDGATQFRPRSIWGNPTENNTFNSGRGQPFNRYQNQFIIRNDDNDYKNGSTRAPSRRTWQNIGTNPRSPSSPRRDPQPSRQYQPSRSSTPDSSVFQRSNSQESSGFVPYVQRFLRTIDQPSSHAVRFTTTDDSINALSDLCPLNWWALRSLTPIAQGVQDLALFLSILPPETLRKIVDQKLNSC